MMGAAARGSKATRLFSSLWLPPLVCLAGAGDVAGGNERSFLFEARAKRPTFGNRQGKYHFHDVPFFLI
jgi:hypothetical protein